MLTHDPVDQFLSGRMDRRTLGKALGSLGVGIAAMPLVAQETRADEEEANFFTWGGL